MLRRLFIGLALGLVVGGLLAAGLVAGLKVETFLGSGGGALAYAAASLTGIVTGLVAGRPIWASGAKVEAALKALFGALLGAGAMFALRRWAGGWAPDLHVIGGGGPAAVGDLPAASLPMIAAGLGALFELDNTGDVEAAGSAAARKRVPVREANGSARARVDEADAARSAEEAEVAAKRAKP
jgi:hypothetical protein